MAEVQIIPPKKARAATLAAPVTKRLTAGYARVSTEKEEQQQSYEAQVDYYTRYIKSRPELEFVDYTRTRVSRP
jgi:predicted site-specific integrase-resolvase